MSEIELKPCPFCGCPPVIEAGQGHETYINCATEGCAAEGICVPLAKAWNRRAAPAAPLGQSPEGLVTRALEQIINDYSAVDDPTDSAAEQLFADARKELVALTAAREEVESLRAQCGLRQIAGYAKGRVDAESRAESLAAELAASQQASKNAYVEIQRLTFELAAKADAWQLLDAEFRRVYGELAALKAEAAGDKRDALRYRWLRKENGLNGKAMIHICPPHRDWGAFETPESWALDSAIDAALQQDKPRGKE